MIWRAAMLVMQLGLLAAMGLAFWRGPSNAPIFSHAQRMPAPVSPLAGDTPDGTVEETGEFEWRAGTFGNFFEAKEYHLAMARDWLSAASDSDFPGDTQPAVIAAEHARLALAEGPANVYAWLFLAWAENLSGQDENARAALAASWRWGPYSRNIALLRARLASLWWPDLEPADRERVLNDLLVAYAVEKDRVRGAIAADQRLRAIWRLALAYKERLREGEAKKSEE